MKKRSWLDEPITWRKELKMSGIVTAVCAVIGLMYAVYAFHDRIEEKVEKLTNRFKAKFERK